VGDVIRRVLANRQLKFASPRQIAAVQALSITGALRLGGTFLSRHPSHPPLKAIYIPNPTTEEDAWALKDAGLEIRLYRFFDRKTGTVDWEGMREDLQVSFQQHQCMRPPGLR
jgi:aspartate/tyrosine/aromatic aminotransferase